MRTITSLNTKWSEMPNSFKCTNGISYLLRDIFNMALPVYILIDILNSKGFSGGYFLFCVLVYSKGGLSINCDNFCLDVISIFRVS